jgi:predicted component of type VI protein secretion system
VKSPTSGCAKRGHPEELFTELSRLAGALCTFALDSHPRDLPLYDHRNLSESFERLDRHIREHLETIVPTNCISIPLTQTEPYYYEGEITDSRALGRSRWVFAVHAAMGEAELMARAPQLIKVCTPPFVRELVKRALPGLNTVLRNHPQRPLLGPHGEYSPSGRICAGRVSRTGDRNSSSAGKIVWRQPP